MKIAPHHESTLFELQRHIAEILPADQKCIVIVFDDQRLLTRQASWLAPGSTPQEAETVIHQLAGQL